MNPKTLRSPDQVDTYSSPAGVAESLVAENMSATAGRTTAMTPSGEQSFRLPFNGSVTVYLTDVPESDDEAIIAAVTERFEREEADGFVLFPVEKVVIVHGDVNPTESDVLKNVDVDPTELVSVTVHLDLSRITETQPLP